MSKLQHCQFCYQLYSPPRYFRAPSQSCDACWLTIQTALSQPEPDFSGDVKKLPGYFEPTSWVIQ